MDIFGNVLRGLGRALDLHGARHEVINENLANVHTPGYRARDVDFADALRAAFAPDEPSSDATPEPAVDPTTQVKADGNSVDLDVETTRLAENAFRMVALSRIVAKKYAGIKETIAELR
jgi:flagellar basal-body rod protein FlgB